MDSLTTYQQLPSSESTFTFIFVSLRIIGKITITLTLINTCSSINKSHLLLIKNNQHITFTFFLHKSKISFTFFLHQRKVTFTFTQLLLSATSTSTGIILDHRFIIIFINRTFIKESVAHRFTFSLIITSSLTGDKETHQFTFPIKGTSSFIRDNRPQWLTFSTNNFFTRRLMTFASKETTHLPRWNLLAIYLHKVNFLIQPKITQISTITEQGSLRFIVDFNCSYSSSLISNNHEPNDISRK